jgi:hypothetical protein
MSKKFLKEFTHDGVELVLFKEETRLSVFKNAIIHLWNELRRPLTVIYQRKNDPSYKVHINK